MKKFYGTYSDLDEDFFFNETTGDLEEVIVTSARIAMQWKDGDSLLSATLKPVNDTLPIYQGDMIARTRPMEPGRLTAFKYELKNGGILLLAKWEMDNAEGFSIFELEKD